MSYNLATAVVSQYFDECTASHLFHVQQRKGTYLTSTLSLVLQECAAEPEFVGCARWSACRHRSQQTAWWLCHRERPAMHAALLGTEPLEFVRYRTLHAYRWSAGTGANTIAEENGFTGCVHGARPVALLCLQINVWLIQELICRHCSQCNYHDDCVHGMIDAALLGTEPSCNGLQVWVKQPMGLSLNKKV